MKTSIRIIALLIISYVFILSCNNASKSSNEQEDLNLIAEEATVNELKIETKNKVVDEDERIIPFESAKWYIKSDNVDMFNGLNTSLMSGVALTYAKKKHFDPKIDKQKIKDSLVVDLKKNTFSIYHKTASKLNMFDVEYQILDDRTRIAYGDEEISDEELAKREKEKQETLNDFVESNQHLKTMKAYDVQVIRGSFQILQVKNNSIELKIEGNLIDMDAFTFHAYGEDGPASENPFSDKISIDLMEAFNDIGSIHKFTMSDLQVVNNQSLKYLRNQFFARKGYIFKTDAMNDYFGSKPWYTPEHDDVSDLLSKEEKYNAEFIKQFEEGK